MTQADMFATGAIQEWGKDERPLARLLAKGAGSLTDAEILSLLLRSGSRERSALDISKDLISMYGDLRGVLNAPQAELLKIPGMGAPKVAYMQAALELGRRHLEQKMKPRDVMTNPESVNDFLSFHLRDRSREIFAVLFLDNRHQVIEYEEMFQGTLSSAAVHPREIIKQVLYHNAAAVILAHNHPSGIAEPSQSDADITVKIQKALQLIDVRLLDHIVVGDGEFVSLSNRGIIQGSGIQECAPDFSAAKLSPLEKQIRKFKENQARTQDGGIEAGI